MLSVLSVPIKERRLDCFILYELSLFTQLFPYLSLFYFSFAGDQLCFVVIKVWMGCAKMWLPLEFYVYFTSVHLVCIHCILLVNH